MFFDDVDDDVETIESIASEMSAQRCIVLVQTRSTFCYAFSKNS